MNLLGFIAIALLCQVMALWMLGNAVEYLQEGKNYRFATFAVTACMYVAIAIIAMAKSLWGLA